MSLESIGKVYLWIIVPWLSLRLLRAIWMTIQGRRAVRRWLNENGYSLISFYKAKVFKDCGSYWASFAHLGYDYTVMAKSPDGKEQELWLQVEFVPFFGLLREVRNLDYERPYPNGLPDAEETDPQS